MTTYQQPSQPWQDISSKMDTTTSTAPGYMTQNRKMLNATLNDISERAFRAWVNNVLIRSNKISSPVGHLGTAFSGPTGGLLLLRLFEALLKTPADPNVWKFHESPRNSWEGLENFEIAFEFFNRFKPIDFEVTSYGAHIPERHRFMYDSKELYDGNVKDILGLVFELINFFGVRNALGPNRFQHGKHLSLSADEQRRVQNFFEDAWDYDRRGISPLNEAEKDQFFMEYYGFKPMKWESLPMGKQPQQTFYEEVKPRSKDIYETEQKQKKKLRKRPESAYATTQGTQAFADVHRDIHKDVSPRSREGESRIPVQSGRPQEYTTFISDKDRMSNELKSVVDRYRSDLERERANSDLKFREFFTLAERLREALDRLSVPAATTTISKGFEPQERNDKQIRKEVFKLRSEMNDMLRQFSGSMDQRNHALEREIERLRGSFERLNSSMASPRGVTGEGRETTQLIEEINRAKKDLKRDKRLLETLSEENHRLVEENRRRNADIEKISSNLQQRLWELERKIAPGHIPEESLTRRRSVTYPTEGHRPEEFSREVPIEHGRTYTQQPLSYSRDIPTSSRMAAQPIHTQPRDTYPSVSGYQEPSTHLTPGVAEIYKSAPAIVPHHEHAFQDVPPEYFDRTATYDYHHRPTSTTFTPRGTDVRKAKEKLKEGAIKLKEKGKLAKNKSAELISPKQKHKTSPKGSPKLEKRVEKLEHKMHKYKDHEHYIREAPVTTLRRSSSLPSVHSYLLPPTTVPVTHVRSRSLHPGISSINPIGTLAVIPYEATALPSKVTRPHFDVSVSSQVLSLPYPFGSGVTTTTATETTSTLPSAAPLVFNVLGSTQLLVIELFSKGRTGGVGRKVWGRTVIPLTFIRPDDAKASLDGWFPIEAPWVGGSRSVVRQGEKWSVRRWLASKEGKHILDTRDEYAVTENIRRHLREVGGSGYKSGKNVGGVVGRERGSIRLRIEFNKFLNRENIIEVAPITSGERVVERRLIEEEIVEKPRKLKTKSKSRKRSWSGPIEKEVVVTERDVPVSQVMSGYGGYGAGYGTVAYEPGTVYETVKTEPVVGRETYLTRARGPTLVRTEVVRGDF